VQQLIFKGLLAAMACVLVSCKPEPVAEWVVFESMPDATIYIDPSTVRRDGDRAEMWALIDYKQALPDKTGKQVLSDKIHYQYDCKGKTLSIVDTSAHAGPMASGEIINVNPDPPEGTPVPPGTTAENMWKHACGS
jgi:Surface-adhesin protein E